MTAPTGDPLAEAEAIVRRAASAAGVLTRDTRACPADDLLLRFRGLDHSQQLSWACPAGHLWSGTSDTGPLAPAHQSWCRTDHDPAAATCDEATR